MQCITPYIKNSSVSKKTLRRFVSTLPGKGLKDFSHFKISPRATKHSRREHTARELRVERACVISFTHLCLGLPGGLFPAGLPHQNPVHIYIPPLPVTYPANIIFHYLLTHLGGDRNYETSHEAIFCKQYCSQL